MGSLPIHVVIGLIIGAIILAFLMFSLFRTAPLVLTQLLEQVGGVKYSSVEKALLCYYYICANPHGCSDPITHDYCWQNLDRSQYEEACSLPDSLGVGGLRCIPQTARMFPIKLKLESEEEISHDRIKKRLNRDDVVISYTGRTEIKGLPPVIFQLDGGILTDAEYSNVESCFGPFCSYKVENNVKYAKVKPGEYMVYSKHKNPTEGAFLSRYHIDSYTIAKFECKNQDKKEEISYTNEKTFFDDADFPTRSFIYKRIIIPCETDSLDDLRRYNFILKIESEVNKTVECSLGLQLQVPLPNILKIEISVWNVTRAHQRPSITIYYDNSTKKITCEGRYSKLCTENFKDNTFYFEAGGKGLIGVKINDNPSATIVKRRLSGGEYYAWEECYVGLESLNFTIYYLWDKTSVNDIRNKREEGIIYVG